MRVQKVFDKKAGQIIIAIYDHNDVESVNPIEYYGNSFIVNQMVLSGVPTEELNGKKVPSDSSKEIFSQALDHWLQQLDEIKGTTIPEPLIELLHTDKKKKQEKLLKQISLNPMVLIALIFRAYAEYGFRFSQYRMEILPDDITEKMPFAAEINDDGSVNIFGETKLTEGQVKHAITHRSVTIGKFIDKEGLWHCFFGNYKSIYGKESWLGEQTPHLHYISSAFGIPRENVVNQLKSKRYRLGNLPHVELRGYRNF